MMMNMKIHDAIISLDCCWMSFKCVTHHCMMYGDVD